MWIDGNIHGNEVQAGEVVGYTLDSLCNAHGRVPELTELIDRSVFYLCPSVNPDGRDEWFSKAHTPHSNRTGLQPFDNDRDGESDEDGPDDLDGDGSIGQMWRKDPSGTHRRDPRDSRRFIPVSREPRPDGTVERGEWSYGGEEGIDNDGDGRVNEDGQGGYDMKRNWPSDWQPDHVQRGAGGGPGNGHRHAGAKAEPGPQRTHAEGDDGEPRGRLGRGGAHGQIALQHHGKG
jgi:hypothetical protein